MRSWTRWRSGYKQGMDLLQFCSRQIDTVEKKMLQIDENGEISEF